MFYHPCFDGKILGSIGRGLREPIGIASPYMHSETGMSGLHKLQSDKEGRPERSITIIGELPCSAWIVVRLSNLRSSEFSTTFLIF